MRLLRAAALAAALSGIPSTAHALATGRDPLEAAYAAGTIVLRGEAEPARLLAAGVTVHLAISLGWTVALDRAGVRSARRAPSQDSRSRSDLGLVGRRMPRIAALPLLPSLPIMPLSGRWPPGCRSGRRAAMRVHGLQPTEEGQWTETAPRRHRTSGRSQTRR